MPWNRNWKSIVALIGLINALVGIGALNNLTPSGRVVVQGATIEISPILSGNVSDVPVEAG